MVKRYSRVFKDWAVRMLVDCLAGDCFVRSGGRSVRSRRSWGLQTSYCAAGMSSIWLLRASGRGSRVKSMRKSSGSNVRMRSCVGRMRF